MENEKVDVTFFKVAAKIMRCNGETPIFLTFCEGNCKLENIYIDILC